MNRIKDAEDNLGDSEVREAMLAKAEHFAEVGDREAALKAFEECEAKTVAIRAEDGDGVQRHAPSHLP